jgi:hypothetical protein
MSIGHPARTQGMQRKPSGLLLSLILTIALFLTAAPAAWAQDAGEPQDLLMGQLAHGDFAAGESVTYIVDLPDSTTYVITTGDDTEAAKFTLIITDRRGNEVFNDLFQTTEIELGSGDHAFTLTANEDATLSLFITGQTGEFGTTWGDGVLDNGSFVTVEGVQDTLYADLEIEQSDFWQQAFINVSGDEGDSYSIYVSGEDAYASIGDSTVEGPAVFWTRGGSYSVEIAPVSGGNSLTAVVLLSGPVPELTLGEEMPGTLNPGNMQKAYRFTAAEAGVEYIVALASETVDVDIDMSVSANPTTDNWSSYNSDSNEVISFVAPVAGEYFVRLFTSSEVIDPVEYTMLVGTGEAAPVIETGQTVWDTAPADSKRIFTLPVDEANQLLVVTLVANEDADLDLGVQFVVDDGTIEASLSDYSSNSLESVSKVLQSTGILLIEVDAGYVSEDTPFALRVTLEPVGSVAGQWAVDAVASSEYAESSYTALEATGAPNVAVPADNPLAWTGAEADSGVDTLELSYEYMVTPTGVRIYESFNPGAVTMVEAYDADTDEWSVLWEGEALTDEAMRVFSPALDSVNFLTNRIRLTVQNDLVSGWNEIDAVQLFGLP